MGQEWHWKSTWLCIFVWEIWFLTSRKEHRLMVIVGFWWEYFNGWGDERGEVWIIYNLCCSPVIIRVIWGGNVACEGEMRNKYNILVGRPEIKNHLSSPRYRWDNDIKVDLVEVGGTFWSRFIWLCVRTSGSLLWIQ